MTHVIATRTVPWIPVAHRLEVVLTQALPPLDQITSAFVFARDSAARTLLTCVDRAGRGWDIPGGHLEPGESATEAAIRELFEETGLVLKPSDLSVFAGLRIHLLASPPEGYRYAALTHMVMFRARLSSPGPHVRPPSGSESTRAAWLPHPEIERLCPGQPWLPLLAE
jgi:8-oxo-dGTP pyrophosphatase MutT (NUDIX family)